MRILMTSCIPRGQLSAVQSKCCHLLLRRHFSTSEATRSGHSRWSKIKHDKAKADGVKNKQRSVFSQEIAISSKLFGPDPTANPRLALAIQTAKKAGFPKASIETAIARGQGVSASGAKLEGVTVEAMIPPTIAAIVDCETDNKARIMAQVRLIIKEHGGQVTPTGYLFNRRGRVVLQQNNGVSLDDIMEPALEAGAIDIEEDDEGRHVVTTEPNTMTDVSNVLMKQLGLQVDEADIVFEPIDRVELTTEEEGDNLHNMMEKLRDINGVQNIYVNAA